MKFTTGLVLAAVAVVCNSVESTTPPSSVSTDCKPALPPTNSPAAYTQMDPDNPEVKRNMEKLAGYPNDPSHKNYLAFNASQLEPSGPLLPGPGPQCQPNQRIPGCPDPFSPFPVFNETK